MSGRTPLLYDGLLSYNQSLDPLCSEISFYSVG